MDPSGGRQQFFGPMERVSSRQKAHLRADAHNASRHADPQDAQGIVDSLFLHWDSDSKFRLFSNVNGVMKQPMQVDLHHPRQPLYQAPHANDQSASAGASGKKRKNSVSFKEGDDSRNLQDQQYVSRHSADAMMDRWRQNHFIPHVEQDELYHQSQAGKLKLFDLDVRPAAPREGGAFANNGTHHAHYRHATSDYDRQREMAGRVQFRQDVPPPISPAFRIKELMEKQNREHQRDLYAPQVFNVDYRQAGGRRSRRGDEVPTFEGFASPASEGHSLRHELDGVGGAYPSGSFASNYTGSSQYEQDPFARVGSPRDRPRPANRWPPGAEDDTPKPTKKKGAATKRDDSPATSRKSKTTNGNDSTPKRTPTSPNRSKRSSIVSADSSTDNDSGPVANPLPGKKANTTATPNPKSPTSKSPKRSKAGSPSRRMGDNVATPTSSDGKKKSPSRSSKGNDAIVGGGAGRAKPSKTTLRAAESRSSSHTSDLLLK